MFLARRPSLETIDRFLRESETLPLSYAPIGIVWTKTPGKNGTLTNHVESGEELFEVSIDPRTGEVMYRIRATSWPQVMLAQVGQPIVRLLQARFRRHSAAAMARASRADGAGA